MQWQSMEQFLHMGGYGLYVWGSYAVTLAVLGLEAFSAVQRRRRALRDVNEGAAS